MKKIFTLIGIMTVIFSVYFMLLVVDKSNYIDESRISDFSLSKQINLETLEECAKESNVCVQIRTFNNYSFGNTDCKVEVINPAKNVKYGAVRSLFPNRHMKIIKAQKIGSLSSMGVTQVYNQVVNNIHNLVFLNRSH